MGYLIMRMKFFSCKSYFQIKQRIVYLVSLFSFVALHQAYAQRNTLDTLYYDKDWKGVSNKAFASFYRVLDLSDKSTSKKHFRDYYITGELQSEGGYISIDKADDNKSVFDGESINYYKSGKIKSRMFLVKGIRQGEFTEYYENGLVKTHVIMLNGKPDGILTQFNENGDKCFQTGVLSIILSLLLYPSLFEAM